MVGRAMPGASSDRHFLAVQMQAIAIQYAIEALEKNTIEKDVSLSWRISPVAHTDSWICARTQIASYIKKEADKKWGPTWHVVVGRSFGSYVTHTVRMNSPSP
jgi:hypothetical protein